MASHSTSFTGADENPLSEGTTWSGSYTGKQSLRRVTNAVQVAVVGSSDGVMTYNTVFAETQSVQATVESLTRTTFAQVKVVARSAAQPTVTHYYYGGRPSTLDGNASALSKNVAGTSTNLATDNTITWMAGDVIKLVVTGVGSQTGYKNGSPILSATDGTITGTGRAGLLISQQTASDVARADDFSVTDEFIPAAAAARDSFKRILRPALFTPGIAR